MMPSAYNLKTIRVYADDNIHPVHKQLTSFESGRGGGGENQRSCKWLVGVCSKKSNGQESLILPVFSYLPPTNLSFFQKREERGGKREEERGNRKIGEGGQCRQGRDTERKRDKHRQRHRKRDPRQRKRCIAVERATQHSFHVLLADIWLDFPC